MNGAQCRDLPFGTMVPDNPDDEAAIAAKHCAGCPVSAECLVAGMAEVGVWGGLTTKERRRIK